MSATPTIALTLDDDTLGRLADLIAEKLREQEPQPDAWLATAEAAEYLGLAPDTLRKHAAAGAVPSEQDGPNCKRYFKRSELDRWRECGGRPSHLRRVA